MVSTFAWTKDVITFAWNKHYFLCKTHFILARELMRDYSVCPEELFSFKIKEWMIYEVQRLTEANKLKFNLIIWWKCNISDYTSGLRLKTFSCNCAKLLCVVVWPAWLLLPPVTFQASLYFLIRVKVPLSLLWQHLSRTSTPSFDERNPRGATRPLHINWYPLTLG